MIRIGLNLTIAALVMQFGCQPYQSAKTVSENKPALPHAVQEGPEITQPIKLLPIDEAEKDPSLIVFRTKLLKAAKEHDSRVLLSILDSQIVNKSDGGRGIKEFKDQWKIDQPDSRLWETLTTIVSMGGSFRTNDGSKEFCAPYIASEWPKVVDALPKGADPLDYEAVIDKEVPLRSEPNSTAPVVTRLTYDVVKVNAAASTARSSETGSTVWVNITTLTGKTGYVLDKSIRGPSDYQACFRKVGRNWLMIDLAARE